MVLALTSCQKGPSLYFKELVEARRTALVLLHILACTYPKRPRCRQCRARRIGLEDLKIFRILLVYIVKQVTRLIILSAAWFSSYSEVKCLCLCYSGQIIESKKKKKFSWKWFIQILVTLLSMFCFQKWVCYLEIFSLKSWCCCYIFWKGKQHLHFFTYQWMQKKTWAKCCKNLYWQEYYFQCFLWVKRVKRIQLFEV